MRTLMYGLATAALVLMLCISGCTSPSVQPVATPVPTTIPPTVPPTPMTTQTVPQTLTGVTWYFVAFNAAEGGSLSVKPGTQITAFFDSQGKVSGSAGCNQYTASYEATPVGLSIGAPATTKMACGEPAGIMTQETLYTTTIQGASGYSLSGNILTVTNSGGKALLTYSTVPPYQMTPAPLTGTTWYLNSMIDKNGQIWPPFATNPISLQFSDAGNISGNAGCNSYSGTYTVSGSSLTISDKFAVTLMYCGEPGVMTYESTYLAALPMMKAYKISGNEITLSDGIGNITMLYDTTK